MPGRYEEVKVVFNNGTLIEGLVLEWADNYGSLYTRSGDVVEIFNVSSNVLFSKTIKPSLDRDPQLEAYSQGVPYEPAMPQEDLVENDYESVDRTDPRLRATSIAELKVQKSKELRAALAARIKSNKVPSTMHVNYESPDFTKFSSL